MSTQISVDLPVPPTSAVAQAVEGTMRLIASGAIGPRGRLPGERHLADSLGLSRTTVRAALRELMERGVVEGHPQRGWFVRAGSTVSDRSSELESFTEVARQRGFVATSDVLALAARSATIDEAEVLQIAPASRVIELVRIRRLDGAPICQDATILVAGRCEAVLQADMTSESLYEVLERRCGVFVQRSSCTLRARGATAEQAAALDLDTGDPVLEVRATTSASDGTVVLRSVAHYRGDAYRFYAELSRDPRTHFAP